MVIESAPGAPFTQRQREAIEYRGGNLLVEAVPGSGKTRVVVARAAALLAEGIVPERILVLTFSRRAVGELQARLARTTAAGAMPEVRTFHGFAARLLAQTGEGGRSRRLLSAPAERALFEHVVATTDLPSLPAGVATSPLFITTAGTTVDDLRRASDTALARFTAEASPRARDLLALEAAQRRSRNRLGVADFDDLIARAARLAATPGSAVAQTLRGRYAHVLVDEFQDTDPAQLTLLAHLGGEIFAVGDAAQAIYGFRGAARCAMQTAQRDLAMQPLPLDESFRCPQAMCDLARAVWPQPPTLRSEAEVAGEIAYRRAATPYDEASFIGEEVAAAIASGTPPHEIAVLVRSAEPLAGLVATELRSRGVAAIRQGGENVLDDLAVDAMLAALSALADPSEPAAWLRLFGHPALRLDPLAMRLAVGADPPRDLDRACALLHGLPVTGRTSGARIADALRSAQALWLHDEPVRAARAFASEADLLGYVIDGGEDAARRSAQRIATFVAGVADVRDVRVKLGLDTSSAAVFAAFRAASATWRADDSDAATASGVAILTIHAAKGLEFDFVAIADAVEGHFPHTWRADTLVSPADIAVARAAGVELGTLAGEHDDEERSLWYVAVTRAKRRVLVTWAETDSDGSPLRPGRFVPLDARNSENARASFRGPLAYVAAPTLRDVQTATSAHLTRPLRTSAMEAWFSCRRKFYYDALLRIGNDERGYRAKLGTLVHRAIATLHEAVRDFRHVEAGSHVQWSAALSEVVRAIFDAHDGIAFDSPLEVDAALRAANQLLERYARSLESAATAEGGAFEVIATEERVTYDIDGVAFRGSIDRVERRTDGSLGLVDIKTGKPRKRGRMVEAYPKLADAVANDELWSKATPPGNPQLPLYRHARPETTSLAYVYLGVASKHAEYHNAALDDRLATGADAAARDLAALGAIDAALTETFFVPWTTGALTTLEPTRFARTCRACDFVTVCPGYQEDDDDD